jgi:outer membrane lipoprotein-sorting protein
MAQKKDIGDGGRKGRIAETVIMDGCKYLLMKAMSLALLIYLPVWPVTSNALCLDTEFLLNKMKESFAAVKDYQADVLVRRYDIDKRPDEIRFTYRFTRPEKIRIDFQSPYSGMIVFYSNETGKVMLQPFPRLPFMKFSLNPDSYLFKVPSGQRIDQTHMGLLIGNIEQSLTKGKRGRPQFQEKEKTVEIRVLAEDHFRRGVNTLYRFRIEKKHWLPVFVDERNADGSLRRGVHFRDLRTNLGISDCMFNPDDCKNVFR